MRLLQPARSMLSLVGIVARYFTMTNTAAEAVGPMEPASLDTYIGNFTDFVDGNDLIYTTVVLSLTSAQFMGYSSQGIIQS